MTTNTDLARAHGANIYHLEYSDGVCNINFTPAQLDAYTQAIQQAAGAVPEYHLIERIAQHWDACIYNTDNGEMDIGAAIRQNAKHFAASPAPPKQQPDSVHFGGGECGGATQGGPLGEEQLGHFFAAMTIDPRTQNFDAKNWFFSGVALAEKLHRITPPDSVAQGKEADHG
jgi:hypothetical protein